MNDPMANSKRPPAQLIHFRIRNLQPNPKNRPTREVFMHFFGMEITGK